MHFNPLTPDNDPTNPFFHPLNQNLNEEKFTKARVMFKGSPSDARRDMRVAKQTGLYDRMTEKPSGKGRVFEITFKSEGQFRRFMSQFEVDLMEYPLKEGVQLDESSLPAYDARLLRQALVLGKNAFKAGKKRQPLKDKNLVSLRGFAKGKGKNEVMKQWLKGWDEENLKEDVQLDEVTGETTVMAKGDRNQYERITRALTAAKKAGKIAGYEGAHYNFKTKVLTLIFDSKAHKPASQRRKVAKMIKDFGLEFSHSIEEGFASDAQRRAAFASGYKAKGKKKKSEEEAETSEVRNPVQPYDPFGTFEPSYYKRVIEPGLHYHFNDVLRQPHLLSMTRRRRKGRVRPAPGTQGEFDLSGDTNPVIEPYSPPEQPDPLDLAKAEEEFTKSQLGRLKKEYDKINKINPESPTYKQLKDRIRKMDTKMLQQIYKANIKFMRGLAFNELSRRGKQPKV